MTRRGRRLAVLAAGLALAGCAQFRSAEPAADKGRDPASARAEYRLEIDAPSALRTLLADYLDLARFQNAPATDGITAPELERLMRAAPAQARRLLETEGYFNAVVTIEREGAVAVAAAVAAGTAASDAGTASPATATTLTPALSRERAREPAASSAAASAVPARARPDAPLSTLGTASIDTASIDTASIDTASIDTASIGTSSTTLPLLRLHVDPGPRTTVEAFAFTASGPLQSAADAGDAAARDELDALRRQWPLQPGDAFRQPSWSEAKNATIARLRADGYAAAEWTRTGAVVDAPANRVRLDAEAASGPLYRLGPIRIEGLSRYDAASVTNLATFGPGTPYTEKQLLDFQERLQKLGLFEGASVVLDGDPATHDAAPVLVRVREQPLQQATLGLGYATDTGARISLEHYQRRVFGTAWIARNKFELGPENQSWTGELTSHPLPDLWRDLVGGSAARLKAAGEVQTSFSARVGRSQETPNIDRLYYAEVTDARVASDTLQTDAQAVSANYHWVFRHLDNVLTPSRGAALSAQIALGYGDGRTTTTDLGTTDERGPFARLYARLTAYRPFAGDWLGSARIEAGQVLTAHAAAVPDTFLFRAGGEDSVRGYGYRTLGPIVDGAVASGRTLLTASLEVAHPISPRYPDFLWAVFVDGGNVADRWAGLHPAYGYGVGLRYKSPVGPLRIDLAYGQQVKKLRVDFSVGVTF